MQKIAVLLWAALAGFQPAAFAAPVSPNLLAKIKAMAKSEVDLQLGTGDARPTGASSLDSAIANLNTRLQLLSQSADYYSGYKRQQFGTIMLRFQAEVMKACCPLKAGSIQNDWFRPRQGRNKGKPQRGRRQF